MNLIQGKERRRVKELIRQLEYQQRKWGVTEVRKARITDLENSLKKRK